MKGGKMTTVYLRDFPEDLHHKAKVEAAIERITLKDLIAKALREYLRRAGVPEMETGQRKEV